MGTGFRLMFLCIHFIWNLQIDIFYYFLSSPKAIFLDNPQESHDKIRSLWPLIFQIVCDNLNHCHSLKNLTTDLGDGVIIKCSSFSFDFTFFPRINTVNNFRLFVYRKPQLKKVKLLGLPTQGFSNFLQNFTHVLSLTMVTSCVQNTFGFSE